MMYVSRYLLCTCILLTALSHGAKVQATDFFERAYGIAMHSDLKYSKDFKHFETANPNAPKGGTLLLGERGSYDNFNSDLIKGKAPANLGLIYDTLMVQNYEEPFSLYGLLAKSVSYPKDRSFIIFHLNPKARFHDGHPVQAEDVVFTYNILLEKGTPFYKGYYADVAKVEALNDLDVKFTFKHNLNKELPLVLGALKVYPKHFWDDKDFGELIHTPPLGSGPYKIESKNFKMGRSVTYSRNPDYWAKDLNVRKGIFNFDKIQVEYYKDSTVFFEGFKKGQFDIKMETSSKRWATGYRNLKAVKSGKIIVAELPHQNPVGIQMFALNTRRPLLQDPALRQALNYAFDFEWINDHLFYGAYKRSYSYFTNSDMAATELPSDAELALLEPFRDQLPPEVFTQVHTNPVSAGDGYNRANLLKAMEILTKAGYSFKNTKLYTPEDKPVKLEFLLYSKDFERIALPYLRNLERIGIDTSTRSLNIPTYIDAVRHFKYDIIVGSIGQSSSPGNEQRNYFQSDFADQSGSRNIMGIKNPVVDHLVEKIIQADTREALVAACRALDRVLLWNHYAVPQWYNDTHRLAYWDKFDMPEEYPQYGEPDFWRWWSKGLTKSAEGNP
jgi:microcin C transport system substrate-binding protein